MGMEVSDTFTMLEEDASTWNALINLDGEVEEDRWEGAASIDLREHWGQVGTV